MLLCLVSKNDLADVRRIFESRRDMPLAWEDFAAHRINWDAKSTNLKSLATLLRRLDAQHHGLGDFEPSEFSYDPLDPAQLAEGGNFVLTTRLGRLDIMRWVPGIPR